MCFQHLFWSVDVKKFWYRQKLIKFEKKCCRKFMKMHSHVSALVLEIMAIISLTIFSKKNLYHVKWRTFFFFTTLLLGHSCSAHLFGMFFRYQWRYLLVWCIWKHPRRKWCEGGRKEHKAETNCVHVWDNKKKL